MNKSLIAAVVLAAVAGGTWVLTQNASTPLPVISQNVDSSDAETASFDVTEMVQGNPDAAVQVTEYVSFTCGHCANFHANQYPQIKENYIDTGRIGFTLREVYFEQPGLWASMVARCGGEMRFFGLTGLLFDNQQDWARAGDGAAIAAALRNLGKVAGLTDGELDACMADGDKAQQLVAWYRQNAAADGIESTPSFVIDGQLYNNMSYDDFAALLDEKLAAAGE